MSIITGCDAMNCRRRVEKMKRRRRGKGRAGVRRREREEEMDNHQEVGLPERLRHILDLRFMRT